MGNFWQDQGYQWQYGYINVTKYGTLITPLSYDTMDNVTNATESGSLALFAKSFASVDYMPNQTDIPGLSNNLLGATCCHQHFTDTPVHPLVGLLLSSPVLALLERPM